MNHQEFKAQLFKENLALYAEYKALEPQYKLIFEVIKLRIEHNLTQKELAKKIGTTQTIISRMENGDYNPSYNFLQRLAAGLGKELEIQFK